MPTEPTAELEVTAQSIDALTAGDILQQERQRLGLNEKEVADQLHITKHYVKALESNSYGKLPGTVFVKGYLKSYALLLGLDVEDLMSRYDELTHQQQADNAQEKRLLKARKKKDRNKPLVIVSLLVFVVGFLGLWLANSYFSEESVSAVPNTVESVGDAENPRPALSQAIEPQVTIQPQLTLNVEPEEITAPTGQLITPSLMAEAEAASEQLPEVDSESIVDSQITERMESAESDGTEGAASLEDLTAALQALRAEQEEPALDNDESRVISIETSGNDILRISFTGESWVEVNDSESQQIYRDIRVAGDVLEITGSAPFSILLGDAPFTRMSLNGDEIDLSADIRIDNSARLTVGL
ncbi:MAG: helix-turn-helix domain-containing protein [Gammaproteobacteria bacterium]|nr:helix-turn-helix domain-containing protein [Gammaproteobacteria bacterium]